MKKFWVTGLATLALAAQGVPESKLGFSVVAEAARAAVKPGEPIVLRLTFRNTSGDAFRLPDQITPPPFNYWYLKLQEATTRKTYTGFSTRPMGAAAEPGEINPELLRGGEVKTASVAFPEFAFLEGDMDFQAARNVWFPQRQSGTFPLPAGTYNVHVVVRFRAFPSGPNLPQNIQDAQRALENDPIPLWKGGEIESNSTQIKVNDAALAQDAETIQIVKDTANFLLAVIKPTQEDAGMRRFTGLTADLWAVVDASNAIKSSDVNTFKARARGLSAAVAQAATRALDISRRSNESPDLRAKASALAMRLRSFPVSILEGTN